MGGGPIAGRAYLYDVIAASMTRCAQYHDSETGKQYNYFRDYDPTLGRFVESDSIGLGGGLNTFEYAASRPLAAIDRNGLLITNLLNGISIDPIHPDDAARISNFSSVVTLGGGAMVVGGLGVATFGPGAAALTCKAARELKDPCSNAIFLTAFGMTFCQGKPEYDIARDLMSRDQMRRASEMGRRETANGTR